MSEGGPHSSNGKYNLKEHESRLIGVPEQSMHILTKVVSSNSVHENVYSIKHYLIKLVIELCPVGDFLRILSFPHQ